MTVKRSQPKQRLRQFFGNPEGILRSQLLRQADEKLEDIRESSLADIDKLVERVEELGRSADPANAQEIYRVSNEIFGVAGAFGLKHLGQATCSLCELVDVLTTAGQWNQAAVKVHLDGIQSLRTGADDQAAARDAIVAGLVKVVAHVTAALEAAAPPASAQNTHKP
jgi:chemotaxis protein histidine kinase CheA